MTTSRPDIVIKPPSTSRSGIIIIIEPSLTSRPGTVPIQKPASPRTQAKAPLPTPGVGPVMSHRALRPPTVHAARNAEPRACRKPVSQSLVTSAKYLVHQTSLPEPHTASAAAHTRDLHGPGPPDHHPRRLMGWAAVRTATAGGSRGIGRPPFPPGLGAFPQPASQHTRRRP